MENLKLPCLRGRIGDWFYYVSVMKFNDIAKRTSMVPEIHKNPELSRWIQREVSSRSSEITTYIKTQEQRFFNSIIFGLYGGSPSWQEIEILTDTAKYSEQEIEYFGKTFGVLNLEGNEKIFAIDGQHRTKAIKDISLEGDKFNDEEIPVIFVAHKNTIDGEIRTRRLFSTLNRYAVPVTISEIIALDEEDNCAIITRRLIEDSNLFKDKILYSKNRSISPSNKASFTNIILLYDIVKIFLTDKKIINIATKGHDSKTYTKKRESEKIIDADVKKMLIFFEKVFVKIPSLNKFFFTNNSIDRSNRGTSLLFRPIGQLVMFSALKIAKQNNKLDEALTYFSKDSFNLDNATWKQIFFDEEQQTLKTDKALQTLAIQIILKHLNIPVRFTKKHNELFDSFKIDTKKI